MKIIYDESDRKTVIEAFKFVLAPATGAYTSPTQAQIDSVLHNVTAAYQSQLREEAERMIEEFELGE